MWMFYQLHRRSTAVIISSLCVCTGSCSESGHWDVCMSFSVNFCHPDQVLCSHLLCLSERYLLHSSIVALAVAWMRSAAALSWRRPSFIHSCVFSLPCCSFLLSRRECSCSCSVKWPSLQLRERIPQTFCCTNICAGRREGAGYWGRKQAAPLSAASLPVCLLAGSVGWIVVLNEKWRQGSRHLMSWKSWVGLWEILNEQKWVRPTSHPSCLAWFESGYDFIQYFTLIVS